MKRFGANKILLDSGNNLLNGFLEIDENRISSVSSLAECQSEPSQTVFFNGTIVAVKSEHHFRERMRQNLPLCEVLKTETAEISIGASVQLFLLHAVDFEIVASDVEFTKL